jgi:hypothetical protein
MRIRDQPNAAACAELCRQNQMCNFFDYYRQGFNSL